MRLIVEPKPKRTPEDTEQNGFNISIVFSSTRTSLTSGVLTRKE